MIAGVSPARVREACVIAITVGTVGLSYGALAATAGLAPWQTLLMAGLVFGGASELTFTGVIASGGSPVAGALGAVLVNTRNLAFGLATGPALKRGAASYLGAHFLHDEPSAFAAAVSLDVPAGPERRRARANAFWLLGVLDLVFWLISSMAGQWLGSVIDADALGLDAAFPVILVCLVLGSLRDRPALAAGLIGMLVAFLLIPHLPAGLGPISALLALLPVAGWTMWRSRGKGPRP
jgi:predicted branched-subunit amino acid permease